jgi:hypothetical protein
MKSGMSMIETLRDFVGKMEQLEIDYMVTGSYAMSAYGEIRMTKDIDVVIQLSSSNASSFFDLFRHAYYVSDASIRRAIDRKSMFNVVSLEHGGKIDCIIQQDTEFALASFARKFKETVSGVEFWTTTREDLMIAKLNWAKESRSEMQIRDIANLTESEYDSDYVADWIKRLELSQVWSEVEQWKIQRKLTNS